MNKASFYKKNKLIGILLLFCTMVFCTEVYAFSLPYPEPKVASEFSVKASHHQEIIVLIHGLMRTSLSMSQLRYYLERQGYQVYLYSYPSAKNSIHEHALYLNQFINTLMNQHSKRHIYFITHSLGGIIAREAIAQLSPQQLKRIDGLIMLAPPNQGSTLAKYSTKIFPMISYFIKPLAELSSEEKSYVHHVPVPQVKIGIIAGRYDLKVPPYAAYLEGQREPEIVSSTHTFIMNNVRTKELIIHFLKTGSLT